MTFDDLDHGRHAAAAAARHDAGPLVSFVGSRARGSRADTCCPLAGYSLVGREDKEDPAGPRGLRRLTADALCPPLFVALGLISDEALVDARSPAVARIPTEGGRQWLSPEALDRQPTMMVLAATKNQFWPG